jgi:virulence-associated protein VapD
MKVENIESTKGRVYFDDQIVEVIEYLIKLAELISNLFENVEKCIGDAFEGCVVSSKFYQLTDDY